MMIEVNIHCPELGELAQALRSRSLPPLPEEPTTAIGTPQSPAKSATAVPTAATNSTAAPTPAPAASTAAAVPTVPVSQAPAAPPAAYDKETLIRAAAELMDQGKQQELLALLARFNVPSMRALDPAQVGDFGAAMKELGAKL